MSSVRLIWDNYQKYDDFKYILRIILNLQVSAEC